MCSAFYGTVSESIHACLKIGLVEQPIFPQSPLVGQSSTVYALHPNLCGSQETAHFHGIKHFFDTFCLHFNASQSLAANYVGETKFGSVSLDPWDKQRCFDIA
jgi:hypothetical protein